MSRTLPLLAVLALVALAGFPFPGALAEGPGTPSPTAQAQPYLVWPTMQSCKPTGPIELQLVQTGARADEIDLGVGVVARGTVERLSWQLLWPDGATLLSGEGFGEQVGAIAPVAQDVTLRLPAPGPVGDGPLRVRLVAEVDFIGASDAGVTGTETVVTTTALILGTPVIEPATISSGLAASSDASEVAVVPVRHAPRKAPDCASGTVNGGR